MAVSWSDATKNHEHASKWRDLSTRPDVGTRRSKAACWQNMTWNQRAMTSQSNWTKPMQFKQTKNYQLVFREGRCLWRRDHLRFENHKSLARITCASFAGSLTSHVPQGCGGVGGEVKVLHVERKNNKCRSFPPALPPHTCTRVFAHNMITEDVCSLPAVSTWSVSWNMIGFSQCSNEVQTRFKRGPDNG